MNASVPPAPNDDAIEAFLCEHFDATELMHFARGVLDPRSIHELPPMLTTPLAGWVCAFVAYLRRRGMVNSSFFEALCAARSALRERIHHIWETSRLDPSKPDSIPKSRLRVRLEIELDELSSQDLGEILRVMRALSGDPKMTIESVSRGSTVLVVHGELAAVERLHRLIQSGSIVAISGFRHLGAEILGVERLQVEPDQQSETDLNDATDAMLLQAWCQGHVSAADHLWARRVDAEVDQRLLTGCAMGEARACERFAAQYLSGLDAVLVGRAVAEGRIGELCARKCEDIPLLARYAAGNKTAGEALFRRYYPVLYRFVSSKIRSSDEVSDIVQETFRDLARDPSRIKSFRPSMFRVAANKISAWFKREYGRPVETGLSGIADLPDSIGSEIRVQERIEGRLLVMALQRLSLDEQMVLELYTWENFSAEDVAEIFGFQSHNVRHMLRNAKQRMREFIATHGDFAALEASNEELATFVSELQERTGELLRETAPARSGLGDR